jgi:hypothetical protein
VWIRNISFDIRTNVADIPQWNFNSTDDPVHNVGGIDLSGINQTTLPLPWYLTYTTANIVGPSAASPGSGTLATHGTETLWNFGASAYLGVFPPTGFTNWPPFPNLPIVSGSQPAQTVRPLVLPFHPQVQVVDQSEGVMSAQWAKFFQRESQKPALPQVMTSPNNPLIFTANVGGIFWVCDPNANVTNVTISRGSLTSKSNISFNTTQLSGAFPLANGDTISVFYNQLPSKLVWMPGSHSGTF